MTDSNAVCGDFKISTHLLLLPFVYSGSNRWRSRRLVQTFHPPNRLGRMNRGRNSHAAAAYDYSTRKTVQGSSRVARRAGR